MFQPLYFQGLSRALAVVTLSLFARTALAQQIPDAPQPLVAPDATQNGMPAPKPLPSPSPKIIKLGALTLSGSLRARAENWNWFESSTADSHYTFGAALLRLALGQQKDKVDWQNIGVIETRTGAIDWLLWGAGQLGRWGNLDHRAGAIAAEAGYQLPVRLNPWLRVGYFRSTGDGNPLDDAHTTFFQALPTPRPYARFPFYNLMNNGDAFAQLRLRLRRNLSLRSDAHYLRLSDKNDLWYMGGGAFQDKAFGYLGRPGGGGKTLGVTADVSLEYNLAPTTTLTFYASGVRGGRVQRSLYPEGGNHPGARFLYFEVTQRF
jgi:hypothetical protein